jgi:hypothetical protein
MPSPANSVALAAGALTVVGYLTQFVGREDDTFFVAGLSAPIASVDSTSQITLKTPLSAGAITDATGWYITKGPGWSSNVTISQQVQQILAQVGAGMPLNLDGAGTLAQRTTYDGQPQGFKFLQLDATPFLLFVKKSGAAGDWSTGQSLQGNQAQSTTDAQAAAAAASTSATNAHTSETNAASSASAAAGSATAAGTSATAAGTSATSAANNAATITGLLNWPLDFGSQADPADATLYDLGIQGT